jgi:ribosomal protein S18 acetylase RimI-like enzyme
VMTGPEFRMATEADAPVLAALIHAAFEEYRGQLVPASSAHDETPAGIRKRSNASHAVLVTLETKPVGCVFYEVREEYVYLSRLSVLPEARGRGLGRSMMEYVEARTRELNRTRVRLGVRVALEPLRAWYERLGYGPIEARTHVGFSEPTYVILEKRLAESSQPPSEPLLDRST